MQVSAVLTQGGKLLAVWWKLICERREGDVDGARPPVQTVATKVEIVTGLAKNDYPMVHPHASI
jgi:hypothetical protein